MRYIFSSIFQLKPGFNLPPNGGDLELLKSKTTEALLTRNLDPHRVETSRGLAIRIVFANRILNGENSLPLEEAIALEIQRVNLEQNKKYGDNTEFLIINQQGNAQLELKEVHPIQASFAVSYEAVDKNKITSTHSQEIASIKAGLGIASDGLLQIHRVAKEIVFFDDSNRAIHNVHHNWAFESFFSPALTHEKIQDIQSCVKLAHECNDKTLRDVLALFSEILDRKFTELERFVFGWAALERFIRSTTQQYENKFFEDLDSKGPKEALAVFKKRVRDLMKERQSIKDKFHFITACTNDESSFREDQKDFSNIKKFRDGTFHSGADSPPPNSSIARLLSKYLKLHLATTHTQAGTLDEVRHDSGKDLNP